MCVCVCVLGVGAIWVEQGSGGKETGADGEATVTGSKFMVRKLQLPGNPGQGSPCRRRCCTTTRVLCVCGARSACATAAAAPKPV